MRSRAHLLILFQTQDFQRSVTINARQLHVYSHGSEPVEELSDQIVFLLRYGARM